VSTRAQTDRPHERASQPHRRDDRPGRVGTPQHRRFSRALRGQDPRVIELASFYEFTPIQLTFIEQLMLNIGLALNLIGTSVRTQELLQQFLGSNVELDKRRSEVEEKAQLLEIRNRELAEASASLEAKAQELARASQYKSFTLPLVAEG
jgi:hypothetical protein